jgi:hypothetical protein
MMQAVEFQRVRQRPDDMVLSDDFAEFSRTPLAG